MTDNRIERMHANGILNKTTMRELDALAINVNLKEMDVNKIQQLCKREKYYLNNFGRALNMSS